MTIGSNAVSELRSRFRGALLRPGEEGYDEVRRVWNGAVDRRPGPVSYTHLTLPTILLV